MGPVSSLAAPVTAAALAAETALRTAGLTQTTQLVLVSEEVTPFLKQQHFSARHTVVTVSRDEQLLDVLERELRRRRVSALHLIGHGSPGEQSMGATELNLASITNEQRRWQRIGAQLEPDAQLILYGCCVGAQSAGQQLVQSLQQLLAMPVHAADHLVGPESLGGTLDISEDQDSIALVLDNLSCCLHTDSVGFNITNQVA